MNANSVTYEGSARIRVIFQKNGAKDDVLVISPDDQTYGYYVTFEQNTMKNKTESYMANGDLNSYIERLFHSVLFDADPYDCVQVDFPTYPTLIVERYDLPQYIPLFLEQLASVQSEWPTEYSGNCYSNKTAESSLFEGPGRIYLILLKTGYKDDKLTIIPEGNGYKVVFDQKNIVNLTETYLTASELASYLKRFVTTITLDADNYEHIQVDFPLYPSTLVSIDALTSYLPLLLENVTSVSNWPSERSGGGLYKNNEPLHATSEYDWNHLAY